jgi:mRNA interferase HigB
MTLIRAPAVDKALRRYREAAGWIAAWRRVVERADWSNLEEVRKTYPSADGVKNANGAVVTVFNVKGGNYRLLTVIRYADQVTYEIDLLSHGEYERGTWKRWQ